MTLIETFRAALKPRADGPPGCFGCAHFHNDTETIQRVLPGISSFSSAHASVRADDGLCARHDTLINGRGSCADFLGRP